MASLPTSQAKVIAPLLLRNADGTFLSLDNDAIGLYLKSGALWEPHFSRIVRGCLPLGAWVADIGANFGYNAVVMGRAVGPTGTVVALEPQRLLFQQLCGNAILNGLSNILAYNCAAGARTEQAELNPVDYFAEHCNFGDVGIGSGGETVEVVTVDQLDLPRLDFIKIDVQGSELEVLQGAVETLSRFRPLLFIEIEERQLNRRHVTGRELIEYIRFQGYVLMHIKNDYPVDYLCLPREREEELSMFRDLIQFPIEVIAA